MPDEQAQIKPFLLITILNKASTKGVITIGPQKPAMNITKSATLVNLSAIKIAKLPMTIFIIRASINIFCWFLIKNIGLKKSFTNVTDVMFRSESAVDITAANNPTTINP